MSYLYLDIETIPTQAAKVRENIAKNILPPGNISKPETIAAWVKEKKPAAVDEAIAKTALDGALGHICCIGWAFDSNPASSVMLDTEQSEADIIEEFFDRVDAVQRYHTAPVTIVGHYIIGFDLPFIWQRSICLGIRVPSWLPRQPRPWGDFVFDTMNAWAGYRGSISMDRLCEALGIDGKGEIDGSMIGRLWAEGRYSEISEYCKGDVERTRAIHQRMQVALGEAA